MCYHIKFGHDAPFGHISDITPKNGRWGPRPVGIGEWLILETYASPHLSYRAKFGHSRSNRMNVG